MKKFEVLTSDGLGGWSEVMCAGLTMELPQVFFKLRQNYLINYLNFRAPKNAKI